HRDLARVKRVATGIEGLAVPDRVGLDEVVLPDPVVDPLPGGGPGGRDLDGLAVIGQELAGAPVGAQAAQVVTLRFEAVLDDALRIEAGLGRVLAALVEGQLHRDRAERVVVPVDLAAVGQGVLVAVLLGRILQADLVEHIGLVVELGRVDRERDAHLALVADLEEIDGTLAVLAQVVAVLGDQRGQVEPLAVERLGTTHADRPDDIGAVARAELGRQRVASPEIGGVIEDELDVRMAEVEVGDELSLDLELAGIVPGAQAAEPLDRDRPARRDGCRAAQRRRRSAGRGNGTAQVGRSRGARLRRGRRAATGRGQDGDRRHERYEPFRIPHVKLPSSRATVSRPRSFPAPDPLARTRPSIATAPCSDPRMDRSPRTQRPVDSMRNLDRSPGTYVRLNSTGRSASSNAVPSSRRAGVRRDWPSSRASRAGGMTGSIVSRSRSIRQPQRAARESYTQAC